MNRAHFLSAAFILAIALIISPAPLAAAVDAPATRPTPVKKISVEEFDKARAAKDAVVVDVRSPEEYADGHVPGAINIPISGKGAEEFDKRIGALDKTKPMLVHCRSGVRSAKAVAKMQAMGFGDLSNFAGGWVAWAAAEKPVQKGNQPGGEQGK